MGGMFFAAGAIGAVDCACKTRTLGKSVAMIIGVAPGDCECEDPDLG